MLKLSDDTWRRHANAWSVWTRLAAAPAMIVSIWSRTWWGAWSLLPIGILAVFLIANPRMFPPVRVPVRWVEKGIFGERIWLEQSERLTPGEHRTFRCLMAPPLFSFGTLAIGLWKYSVWLTVLGTLVLVAGQLARLRLYATLYDRLEIERRDC